ncbi:related to Transcription initiation factor IIA subunit 2 [Saccharomycodes ludwigii]|uniref:Transcription initiation factor IIA subunit 2 n=1 Tax=Saccharomycodes ludwigii TaxID=36035 RepID=A0A376B103_9ASCO|nr:hypothetical protein SCDLUD_004168 [Saccharomycodes ludwigii]KAH3899869.1 hypothetical protein SCDLUD_004168 [Saccharomycodes ludwigii]SSD58358.1 related to Transcription initiation factor IIA subunit 2 [Saccharomycodes ludwigii]
MSSTYYELYRRSTVGATLVDALDHLISEGRIEASLAMVCLEVFDRVVAEVLKEKTNSKMTIKGHLHTYRFCDDVWTFIIKNCNLKLEHIEENLLSNNDKESGKSTNEKGSTKNSNSNNDNIVDETINLQCDKLRIVACNARKSAD